MEVVVVRGAKRSVEEVGDGATVADVMREKRANPQVYAPLLNGRPCHEQRKLKEGDELAILRVIYGG
jgi:sulfur carrier protein ThiS